MRDAVLDAAVQQQLGIGAHVAAEQQVAVCDGSGGGQPLESATDAHSATAGVAAADFGRGVVTRPVELVGARADNRVIHRPQAEVDLGGLDGEGRLVGDGRDVVLDQLWQALPGHRVDGAHDQVRAT